MDIQVGEHANNYAEIAAKDKLSELQLRVRQLVEQVDQIQKEQNYQRVSRGTFNWGQFGDFVINHFIILFYRFVVNPLRILKQ